MTDIKKSSRKVIAAESKPLQSRAAASDFRKYAKGILSNLSKEPVAVLSLIVSILAFLVSFGGFYTSRQALEQTLTQYAEERAIVLTARLGETTDSLTIATTDVSFHFLGGTIEFPSAILDAPQQIQEDGTVWEMGTLNFKLNDFIIKNYPQIKDYAVIIELGIPVLVSSSYTTKGRRYFDKSLYELRYSGTIVEDKQYPLNPKFSGFAFVHHFGSHEALPNLDELLKRADPRKK